MSTDTRGYVVYGSDEIIRVAAAALDGLADLFLTLEHDPALAEFRAYEGMPIEAIVCDDLGSMTFHWTGKTWTQVKP